MANKSIPIRILNEDISNFHHWRETTKSFTDLTGIQVELEYQWLNDYWATIISAYTDRAGEFDVVASDEMLLPLYARQGAVLPLDEFIKRDNFDLSAYSPAAIACATVDKKLYGIPYSNMSNILVYRTDIFEKYGFEPPRTLEELRKTAIDLLFSEGNSVSVLMRKTRSHPASRARRSSARVFDEFADPITMIASQRGAIDMSADCRLVVAKQRSLRPGVHT